MTDALARLRAGLDRDEAIARRADPAEWEVDRTGLAINGAGGRPSGIVNGFPQELDHIARQDPRTTLRRVAAFRQIIEEAEGHVAVDDYERGYIDGYQRVLNILANIYTEEKL